MLHNPVLPSEIKNGIGGVKRFAMATIDAIPDRQFTHEDAFSKEDSPDSLEAYWKNRQRDIWISAW
jgi:hypothetical protein